MEFGWYHEFHRQVPGQSDADAFEQGFEQVEASDEWGLDVFWLAEIHQQARRSVLSAPMNVAGQIAAREQIERPLIAPVSDQIAGGDK